MKKLIIQEKFNPPGGDVLALIENGMDFLTKAREEFSKKKYKHSVVSFWTAVEIMLKVPLLNEHWSLVCTGKKISRSKYLEGDFQSVTYDEACARLEDILEKPLKKETKEIFNAVRQHRNRVVHFHHPQFTDLLVKDILAQQAHAWFALNRFMREDWSSVFGPLHSWKLAFSESYLAKINLFYAERLMALVSPELQQLEAAGATILTCPECRQKARVETRVNTDSHDHKIVTKECHVCASTYRSAVFPCPACQCIVSCDEGEDDVICPECNHAYNRYELFDQESFRSVDEMIDAMPRSGCTSCMSPESVCIFGNGYLCTRCFNFYAELHECRCCGHLSDAIPSNSGFVGCEFCDGVTLTDED